MTARPGPRVVRQWAGLLAGMLAATSLASASKIFWRADLTIYDAALPVRAAPEEVVIVAVDDASIAEIGRWPWPRTTHARLMARLDQSGVRAVAFDILFIETDTREPGADAELAEAISRGPPTVLPLAVEMPMNGRPLRILPPIAPLARVAAAVGHVHLELDRDGVGRSVFLREGRGAANIPHLMLAFLEHAPRERPAELRGARHPAPAGAPDVWVRDYQMMIPFLGPPGHFARVSYADVLRGAVPREKLRDKLVLVGVTAQGTGDAYPTPRSGHGIAMPGVEISANVLQALRSRTSVSPLGDLANVLLSLIPIIVVAIGFLRLSPSYSLILAGATWLTTLGACVFALRVAGHWWPPVAPLAALLVMYPLWSWRRLDALQRYLDEELANLSRESFPFLAPSRPEPGSTTFTDVIERRIEIVKDAAQRARAAQREREEVLRFLSHDMKSPASSIMGLAQLQRDPARALPPDLLSQRLDLLAQRLLALVDGFVGLARAEGADPGAFEEFDLRDALQDAYDEVWAVAQARRIAIELAQTDEPILVRGDRALLARAFINLLGNALKFSAPDTQVQMRCRIQDTEALVEIQDHGPGIDDEVRELLFQRFTRRVHRGTDDPGGAGLGLAFVRVAAQKHGGRASMQNAPSGGAIFAVSIPLSGANASI